MAQAHSTRKEDCCRRYFFRFNSRIPKIWLLESSWSRAAASATRISQKQSILLVRYDENGALGLILNRRTDVPLSQVLDLKAAKDRSDPVYLGGPMGPSAVFALFQSSTKIEKAENIFGSVYLISDKGLFEQTISARPDPSVFHVYLGYAGWTQDQLRTEAQLGAWFVFPADAATVFNSDPDSLWLQMIQKTELQLAKTEPFAETSSQ